MLVVELPQAGGQLAAAGAGGGDHHNGLFGADIGVGAIPLVADDGVHLRGVAGDGGVGVGGDAPAFQLVGEDAGGGLSLVPGDDHRIDGETQGPQVVDELKHLRLVGVPQVPPALVVLDIPGVDADEDLRLVPQGLQKLQLGVFPVAGEAPLGVEVVHQLAAELQVKLVPAFHPLQDVFGLPFDVNFMVKALFHNAHRSPFGFGCNHTLPIIAHLETFWKGKPACGRVQIA